MSEANELVSIIIPFYNSERFLADSIESVLAQTYTHWELLLVDDGSTDTSPEIARKYAARHSESIRCLEHAGHRNHGLAFTRNFGVKNSRGEYLAFLDSDDLWLPHKLATQVARMGENPGAGLLVSPSEYWYDWDPHGLPIRESKVPQLAPGERLYMPPTLLISTHPLGPWGAPCPSSFFMRRSAFDAVGGFEETFNPKTFQMFEDIAFLSKVYLTVPVFVADSCLDRYRCHPDSMSQRAANSGQEDAARRFFFCWLRRYLRKRAIKDRKIHAALRRQTWVYSVPLPLFALRVLRRIANRLAKTAVQAPKAQSAK